MNGHLDTVPVSDPETWNAGPFEPVISADGSKLFGRGASDMKSSVAVMLSVLLAFPRMSRSMAASRPMWSAMRN